MSRGRRPIKTNNRKKREMKDARCPKCGAFMHGQERVGNVLLNVCEKCKHSMLWVLSEEGLDMRLREEADFEDM